MGGGRVKAGGAGAALEVEAGVEVVGGQLEVGGGRGEGGR